MWLDFVAKCARRAAPAAVLVCVAGLAVTVPPPALAAALPVRVVECDQLPASAQRIVAEPLDAEASDAVVLEADAARGLAELELVPGTESWLLRVASPGVWSEARHVEAGGRETVHLHVWRESRAVGRWAVPRGEKGPDEVVWRLRPARQPGGTALPRCPVEELTVSCSTDEEGRFSCALPAGRWNLRAKARGWAAKHFWAVDLAPGQEVDLGRLELRRGATLVGEVTTIDGPVHPQATRIELRPIAVRDQDPAARRELRALDARARVNEQGYFLFEDVPPGLYEVWAHQPGYSVARAGPVEVRADLETTILQPLVLAPPTHLTVMVDPPRAPSGHPWRVHLDPTGQTTIAVAEPVEGDTDAEGRWTSPALDPGEYLVRVADGAGNVLAVEGPFSFAGGEEPFLGVALDLAEISGEVRLGDEPFAAELWFGGRTGAPKVRVESDAEGKFEAVLPRDGRWEVDVFAPAVGISARGHEVEVEDGEEVRIELPGTELAGSVVDAAGMPVVGAQVRVVRVGRGGPLAILSDEEGGFLVRGIAPGTYSLEAISGNRSSPMEIAVVAKDAAPPPVRLVLEARVDLRGRVLSAGGGVAGARVVALPVTADGSLAAASDVVTGVDGGFALRLPPSTSEALLVVMPLGFGLTVERVAAEGPLELRVTAGEGIVRLPPPDGRESGEVGLLLVRGEPVDVALLREWARLHGAEPAAAGGLAIPALPAGRYAYCSMSVEEAVLVVAGRARPTRCSSGLLTAAGELALPAP